ncbi:MAG: helix-turn-helix transcriptional regulator, partial [Myxococcota bacterium]
MTSAEMDDHETAGRSLDLDVHGTIERIYATVLDPTGWAEVVRDLSRVFGGSPVAFGFLAGPERSDARRYACGVPDDTLRELLRRLAQDTPWTERHMIALSDRFGELSEEFDFLDVESLPIYTEWMRDLGLAPIWPAGHVVVGPDGKGVGGVAIFRRQGQGPFQEAEFGKADPFVPHLRRALELQRLLSEARRERLALAEAVDRFPNGVLLLDEERQVVIHNQAARRIVDAEDGFRIDRGGPGAVDARDNARLQELIANALDSEPGNELAARGWGTISRPSGRREYALVVTPLTAAPFDAVGSDIRLALFVVDPEEGRTASSEVLEGMYDLTHSEAELVRTLASGVSLEQAAKLRGVSVNTARSHLKR